MKSTEADKPTELATWADDRFAAASPVRRLMNKVFPDHWSFLLGEIALYSFIILVLSGTFLTLYFNPSMSEVAYKGSYVPLQGVHMSQAYESTLHLSFEVRGGLIMRQIHHWSALLFVGAIMIHMFRVFFTGAFRRPREMNWLIGFLLFVIGFVEGFLGYTLPDDALSGTGLRVTSAIIESIPLIGSWIYFALFGGEFPGTVVIGRFYIIHVLILPGLILGLIAAHMGLLVKQKHTQWPGPGATEHNVIGHRMVPNFSGIAGGWFMLVFGVTALLSGLFQINPIWLFGPYLSAVVSAGSQPDFYMGWTDGIARLWPSWEFRAFHHTIPAIFFPVLGIGAVVTIAAIYPWLERKWSGDRAHHNLLERPRDNPTRTGLGALAITFFMIMLLSGANDIIAAKFDISLNAMTWAGRVGLLLAPPLAYYIAHRVCLGLQQHDRQILAHGIETGQIKRLPSGQFIEVHQPLGPVDEHGHTQLEYYGAPVPKKMNRLGALGTSVRGFFVPVEKPSDAASPISPAVGQQSEDEEIADESRASGGERELTGPRED